MSSILNADHLAEQEQAYSETGDAPEQQSPLTLADVVDRLRRIAYHRRMIAQEEEEAEALIAPLQAEIDRIREWQKERRERRERIIELHQNVAIAYYRMNPPAKGKTIKLPNGKVSERLVPERIEVADEKTALTDLEFLAPELIRRKAEVDMRALAEAEDKGKIRRQNGEVFVVDDSGQVVPLRGFRVKPAETKITVKVEEG